MSQKKTTQNIIWLSTTCAASAHALNPFPQQWREGFFSPSPLLGRTPRGRVGMGWTPRGLSKDYLARKSFETASLGSMNIGNVHLGYKISSQISIN